jgi:hypothetical protein
VITEMTMTMHVFEHAPVGPRRCNARGFTGLLSLALTVALAAPVHAAPAKSATSAKSAGPAKSTTGASGRPSRAAAGPADTADATEEDVGIDVTIGTGIPRAQALRTLVRDDVSRVLRALDVELGGPERVRLAIELGGTPPDFRVQLGVSRSGSQVTPVPEAFVCTCTHEELRTRINQAAVKLVPTLKGEPAVTATDDPVPPPVVAPRARRRGDAYRSACAARPGSAAWSAAARSRSRAACSSGWARAARAVSSPAMAKRPTSVQRATDCSPGVWRSSSPAPRCSASIGPARAASAPAPRRDSSRSRFAFSRARRGARSPIMTIPFAASTVVRRPAQLGLVLAAGVTGLLAGVACKTTNINEEHCARNDGNQTCAERYGDALPYCATTCDGKSPEYPISPNGDGCVDWSPPDGCYSPCGGEQDVTEDDSCLDVAGTESSSMTVTDGPTTNATTMGTEPTTDDPSSTQGPTTATDTDTQGTDTDTDTGPTGCVDNSECTDPNAPLCLEQLCVPCGEAPDPDAACAEVDSATPACGASGACVQCTDTNPIACDGTSPVCDTQAQTCRGCAEHDECGETACAFATGECFPEDCILEVPGDHASLEAAINAVPDDGFCVIRLSENGGTDYVDTTVVIDGGKRIAFLNAGGSQIIIQGTGDPTFTVSDASEVYLHRLRVSGNGSDLGLQVSGNNSSLDLDRTEVVDNNGGGIAVAAGAYLRLRNSIVGGDSSNVDAVGVANGDAEILSSTLFAGFGNATALGCGLAGSATVRNSILVANTSSPELDCADATVTYSALESLPPGEGNVDVGDVDADDNGWFVNVISANFRLSPAGAAIFNDIARWTTGDPLVDIDGEPRAGVDGTMEHAGADIP